MISIFQFCRVARYLFGGQRAHDLTSESLDVFGEGVLRIRHDARGSKKRMIAGPLAFELKFMSAMENSHLSVTI
jgi:hypothetical protein